MGLGGQRHAPAALYPRERPRTHCIGGWVGTKAGVENLAPPAGIRSPDRPARSEYTHVHTKFIFSQFAILSPPKILVFPPESPCIYIYIYIYIYILMCNYLLL